MNKNETELKTELTDILNEDKIDYQKVLELSSKLSKFDEEYLRFTVDARTLVSLGRNSIKNHTTALIELVKNSYDADATIVIIDIFCNNDNSYIRIADDGIGMTSNEVIQNWLRIGYSEKRINKFSQKNRRKTGEKGIGRLSADRLGSNLKLITKSHKNNIFGLEINWEDFESEHNNLENIKLKIIKDPTINIPQQQDKGKSETGTELIITNLRQLWTDNDIQNLRNELAILTSPNKNIKDFEIWVNTDIESKYNGKIESPFRHSAEVEILVEYDGKDSIKYLIKDKYDFSENKERTIEWNQLISNVDDVKSIPVKKELKCGSVIFELKFYPIEASMIKDTDFKLKNLREFLNKYHGVKIYRDNICVKPYGFPNEMGNDWLDLGERQGKDPAGIDRPSWKVKLYQLLGEVYISRDANFELADSAAREGLVNSEAFYDLRALVLAGVNLLETHRYKIFQNIESKPKQKKKSQREILEEYKNEVQKLKIELAELEKELESKEKLLKVTNQIDVVIKESDRTEKTINELLNKQRTLAGLATIGISSAVFGHETETLISSFQMVIGNVLLSLQEKEHSITEVIKNLQIALNYAERINAWGSFAITRIKRDKREKILLNLKTLFEEIIEDISPNLNAIEIVIKPDFENIEVETYPMDIESILLNLLTNAFTACLNSVQSSRIINIKLQSEINNNIEGFSIIVSDTGNGIDDRLKEIIWEPLFTTKIDREGRQAGTGLGLSIVNSIVEDLKGIKSVDKDNDLKGAKFRIWLPKR